MKVIIAGAGVAGPAAAFWLAKEGHEVTLIERFPSLRVAGLQVDLRNEAIEVVRRMGLLQAVRERSVPEMGTIIVDSKGQENIVQRKLEIETESGVQGKTSAYEIMRRDLIEILYDATKESVTYRFGLSVDHYRNIKGDDNDEQGHKTDKVEVTLSDGSKETYDLLIAADGQGSRIRKHMFFYRPEEDQSRWLGVFSAYYTLPRRDYDTSFCRMYHATERRLAMTRWHKQDMGQVYLMAMSNTERFRRALDRDVASQKDAFAAVFRGMGWQEERILHALTDAEDFYADEMLQRRSTMWSDGRVVLLGDSAYCASPIAGVGSSMALIGAYVLAGELAIHGDKDVGAALASYRGVMQPLAEQSQRLPKRSLQAWLPLSSWSVKRLHVAEWVRSKGKGAQPWAKKARDQRWLLPDYPEMCWRSRSSAWASLPSTARSSLTEDSRSRSLRSPRACSSASSTVTDDMWLPSHELRKEERVETFPAHFPTFVFAAFAIYVPAFLATYRAGPSLQVVDDEIDVVVKEVTVSPNDGSAPIIADEVDVQEKVLLREAPVSSWKILAYGAPNPQAQLSSILTFLINGIFVALTADALFRARILYPADDLSFVRLGYVSNEEAKMLLREPDQTKMPVTVEIRIADAQPPFEDPIWRLAGGLGSTTSESDFTGIVTIPLKFKNPRWYEYRTSNNHTGRFLSAPRPGHLSDKMGGKFTFLSTSCILPRFPYNPLDHALAIPGLRHLADKLPELSAQFMLFLGDFIYIDVPSRFGKSVDEYRMQYRQVYASPDWAPVAQNLSWIHVLDDHEISNDWDASNTGVYQAAVEPWATYQANVNPPKALRAGTNNVRSKDSTWYAFAQGPASFFLMDTRSYRSRNKVPFEDDEKTMLGAEQLEDFLAWLARPEPRGIRWKIVASSVPFTKNWPVNVQDTWGGFLVERRKILEAMWDAGARGMGVLILSGDRHEFAATKFPPPADSHWPASAAAHEISTSPLNQFASPFPTYRQTDEEDVKLKYIPSGSSKFGAFTIENIDGESSLQYQLYVDGKEAWNTTLIAAEPAHAPSSSIWDFLKF
ncbi:alkaline phosphatase [Cordyceps javanica]|uniref:Alkaline phosphatase n=1 Tax=Cordyceps javanica TaxID=43265 RepID=A0A545VTJ5_9HYPO|nr:alkaline phosphatase [Cordyceps javanica]TQW05047.1 alkaline phosphatase [Cordyceps javanica]